jgi:hypothetical protein
MQNKSRIRKSLIRSFLVLCLAAGTLTPLTAWAWDSEDPQEGGRTRSGPRVTCTATTYNIIIATITVTECSDGTRSVSLS